jgi:hypothetical protein
MSFILALLVQFTPKISAAFDLLNQISFHQFKNRLSDGILFAIMDFLSDRSLMLNMDKLSFRE